MTGWGQDLACIVPKISFTCESVIFFLNKLNAEVFAPAVPGQAGILCILFVIACIFKINNQMPEERFTSSSSLILSVQSCLPSISSFLLVKILYIFLPGPDFCP